MKIAICDDQRVFRKELTRYIYLYNKSIRIYEYDNGKDMLDGKEQFDMIFLDIEMPGMNGMQVAKELRRLKDNVKIVFLTSHLECVYDAFEVNAFRFLKKPIDESAIRKCLEELEEEINNIEKIVIKEKSNVHIVGLDSIVYFEAYGDGTYIYDLQGKVYNSPLQLKEWENRLENRNFFKIHRSYMVSLKCVRGIEDGKVCLKNSDDKLVVSRRNMVKFKEAYFLYIKKNAKAI